MAGKSRKSADLWQRRFEHTKLHLGHGAAGVDKVAQNLGRTLEGSSPSKVSRSEIIALAVKFQAAGLEYSEILKRVNASFVSSMGYISQVLKDSEVGPKGKKP
ncbi:MAG: hypothetical protein IPP19_09285 [Verrucomicrobia bacterium]|nr:hypothetical protein [Verrucomicrobiota bacterium]